MTHRGKQAAALAAALTFAALTYGHLAAIHAKLDTLQAEVDTVRSMVKEPAEPAEGIGRYTVLPEETPEEPTGENTVEVEEIAPAVQSLGTFKLTAYCPCAKCCGKTDGITYTGTKATPDRTVAVDPNVIPLGSTLYINGSAYVAEDIGGAIKGNRIDVFFPDHNTAKHFGVQYAEVTIQS